MRKDGWMVLRFETPAVYVVYFMFIKYSSQICGRALLLHSTLPLSLPVLCTS